jgi:hypothetical protein
MKGFIRTAELLLGILFLGAGLNGYFVLFGFEPFAPTNPAAMEFLGDGYLLAMEKGIEIIAGILLIIRRFIPLVLVALTGIIVNIFAFHIFVDPELLLLAIVLVVLEGILVWAYRENYKGIVESKPHWKS